jgi:hypothetical protein
MAILEEQPSGVYRTRIYFAGRQRSVSLRSKDKKTARALLSGIENALWRLKTGNADLPPGMDSWDWVIAGGKSTARPTQSHSFAELVVHYRQALPEGAKADSTRQGEEIHFRHLQLILGKHQLLSHLNREAVQKYVAKRSKQKWRDKPISGATIRKELRTLSILWTYAESLGWVTGKKPTLGVMVARPKPKETFHTLAEIRQLAKSATPERQAELWDACFLDQAELRTCLQMGVFRARRRDIRLIIVM